MTITADTVRHDYTATGADTFPFTFIIYDQDYIAVYVDGVLQTVDVDYTIATEDIENDDGGDVVFEVASTPAAGAVVTLLSVAPFVQGTSLALRDATYEDTYDKAVILINQLKEMIGRCIKFSVTSTYDSIDLPDPSAGTYLKWNDDGDGLENASASPLETGDNVSSTVSSGVIAYVSGTRNVDVIGEGDGADTITGISGGAKGDVVTLWRTAGKAYSLVVAPGSGLHMQNNQSFTLDTDYDNITFMCRSAGVWAETGGRGNNT